MQTRSEESTHITMPNFLETGLSKADILRFFQIFKIAAEIAKFYWLFGVEKVETHLPYFVKIGQSVAKILRFFDFSRWRPSATLD